MTEGPVHPSAQPAGLAVRPRRPEPASAAAEPAPADPQVRPEGPGDPGRTGAADQELHAAAAVPAGDEGAEEVLQGL